MSYRSVDELQRVLADNVFDYAQDKKKAAGRALGTIVETIAFYLLQSWGLRDNMTIERSLSEFANAEITHNVEYCLHPVLSSEKHSIRFERLPLTTKKLCAALGIDASEDQTNNDLLSSGGLVRNCCTIVDETREVRLVHLDESTPPMYRITEAVLHPQPFAILECKRVGIEEGMKKGPQTIEKAKQGAYVARAVSSLQKVRSNHGHLVGVLHQDDDTFLTAKHDELLRRILDSNEPQLLRRFILTIGMVSNHGNWFTSENHNKELKVLAHSYDWLLFLTDNGLAEFIEKLLLKPSRKDQSAADAFRNSYAKTDGKKNPNRFTKVGMDLDADKVLRRYFVDNRETIEKWFNVISPRNASIAELRDELKKLAAKNWERIHRR